MTYPHALRYLTAPSVVTDQATGAVPLTVKFSQIPVLLCFTRNKLGSAAASLVAAILHQAGISCLHWIDDEALEPKSRFRIDGRPITPPLLSRHAANWQAAARARGCNDIREERCAGVLSLCAAESNCRIILLESPLSVCHVGYFHAINKKIKAISVLSDGHEIARAAKNPATTEIITPAYGRAMHSQITDICAGNDGKMVTIPTSAVRQTAVSLGSQTVTYADKTGERHYRLPSASSVATDAAAMALYGIHSLRERGFSIPEDAIGKGLLGATLSHCGSVYSMEPLILTHLATDENALSRIAADLAVMQACAPLPLTVWAESESTVWPPDVAIHTRPEWPTEASALVLVGSFGWIEDKLSRRETKKRQK